MYVRLGCVSAVYVRVVRIYSTREHTTRLKPYNIIGPYILFTAGAAKLHDALARRDSEDGARHSVVTSSLNAHWLAPLR